ncbi:unnamed protein product [Kluyveromyces dobzhanskii CBS 2104]|uniref:WGS project CCBQ000000000 data, contig 00008 n=1 Tax=Kluyveromyces dobzhanskii CBS 2104 TaxID=1427455 RepID=A0A0A8L7L1_9SACH|nr:unnamed protein product [Kluyveromyces dobzhanskii CBS 2104]
MDVAATINKLRANFLKQSSERDQLNRVIKPFGEVTETTLKLYEDEHGESLLQRLNSPPICDGFVKYGKHSANYTAGTESKLFSSSQNNTMVSLVEEEDEGSGRLKKANGEAGRGVLKKSSSSNVLSGGSQSSSRSTSRSRSNSNSKSRSRSRSRSRSKSIIGGDPGSLKQKVVNTLQRRYSELSLQSTASKSSGKMKIGKKSGLRLSRLFRSSSPSSKETAGNKSKFIPSRSRAGSLKKPAMNLYDHFLYTNEGLNNLDDEDDDDEDDKYEYDKGAVLNFFGKEKHSSGSSSGSILDERLKPTRKTTFLENFPLNPHNILQSSDTVTSQEIAKSKDQPKVERQTERDPSKDAPSYIESYLNQPDLKTFGNDQTNEATAGSVLNPADAASVDDKAEDDALNSHSYISGSTDGDMASNDDASSYGKSLLDSDFSEDGFISSQMQSSDLSSMTFDSHEIPNNSIPRSRALTIYHSNDDSTLDKELYKATKLLHLANKASREPLSQSVPRETGTTGTKKVLNTFQLELRGSGTRHRNSTSSIPESIRSRHLLPVERRRRTSSIATQSSIEEGIEKPPSEPQFAFQRVEVRDDNTHNDSHLSMLFSKSKTSQINPLEYFCGVSAENELPSNTLKLDVYIQDSKKYKRKPFPVHVKKTATVFEVLGYSLYCYSTKFEPADIASKISADEIHNPNYFTLKIVDEDGEPYEDNFGVLERTQKINTIFDNEVVICKVSSEEQFEQNERETPLPSVMTDEFDQEDLNDTTPHLNQLSYYKSIIPTNNGQRTDSGSNFVTVKVFLYPNLNPQYNFTDIRIPVTSKINEILVSYCKLKNLDPTEYVLKMEKRNIILDLNDYVTSLDGNYNLEVLKKRDARTKNFERMRVATNQPVLPTIQSTELTPLTLTMGNDSKLLNKTLQEEQTSTVSNVDRSAVKTSHSKNLFHLNRQNSNYNSTSGFFKLKNSSKSSLSSGQKSPKLSKPSKVSSPVPGNTSYKDLLAGSYYKYKVWRRQQMSFINKHERTLVIDGDYVYISGPDGDFNWTHENVKTKSFHISQITLVKRSKHVPEYFKIFVHRPDRERRYYFEAVSPEECVEIITRLQNLIRVYRMNHK